LPVARENDHALVSEPFSTVRVSRKGADRFASGHPWIFASDVTDRGQAAPGDAVRVLDHKGRFIGIAHYSSTSQICLRRLSERPRPIDRLFFESRLRAAEAFRRRVVTDSDSYRLVFSEADLLPGLIIDRYAGHFVMQALDQGMDCATATIAESLSAVFPTSSILVRNDAAVRKHENLPLETRVVKGDPPERVPVHMNGLTLEADLVHGQKTGVYLDQRENYLAAARHARGRALDCFTSTGGFALHLASRCDSVTAIDSSETAIRAAQRNAALNSITNVEFREANAFDFLAAEAAAGPKYSTVILDPPAFTKSRSAIEGAARGYKEINLRALRLLEPGGILITCSCSHHMSEAMLLELVASAALDAGKTLRIIERRTQASDHPILLTVPETHYLKCLIFEALEI
jgi:23S rRNA (cytosine1962-C5)-methyltransferase